MAISTVFSQVIQLIPRSEFQSLLDKHQADKGVRTLDSWTWFGVYFSASSPDTTRSAPLNEYLRKVIQS